MRFLCTGCPRYLALMVIFAVSQSSCFMTWGKKQRAWSEELPLSLPLAGFIDVYCFPLYLVASIITCSDFIKRVGTFFKNSFVGCFIA